MKVAVVCNYLTQKYGFGDFLHFGLQQLCESTRFTPGEEAEGFDQYFYVDDGPTYYDEPKFHPATYFAIDLVIPHVWFVHTPEQYVKRMRNFDYSYVFTGSSQKYCKDNGIEVGMIGFAADPSLHKPYKVDDKLDWIAVWNNCGDRIEVINKTVDKFPRGRVLWAGIGDSWKGTMDYSYYISTGRCALNWPRANMTNMRVFEVMATGVPLVTMRQEDMLGFGFVENEHYLGYDNVEEMWEKIQWVKDNPTESDDIARRAREIVLDRHTYYHRALEILHL